MPLSCESVGSNPSFHGYALKAAKVGYFYAGCHDYALERMKETCMPVRYVAQGPLMRSANVTYVPIADYEALEAALKVVVCTAHACFKQIEAGELSAADADAEAALFSIATLAGYTLTV